MTSVRPSPILLVCRSSSVIFEVGLQMVITLFSLLFFGNEWSGVVERSEPHSSPDFVTSPSKGHPVKCVFYSIILYAK